MSGQRYRVNSPAVVHDIIDHEVVVIDFNTGSYYSLEGASASLWSMVAGGSSVTDIVEHFGAWNSNDGAEMETVVMNFLGQLEAETLIVEESDNGIAGTALQVDTAPIRAGAFTGFSWQKFSDMNQLLLLDPIHEVDAAGWPHQPSDASVTDGRQR
jgi:Coenzyme PQQ synthesis protein D (PqqD)